MFTRRTGNDLQFHQKIDLLSQIQLPDSIFGYVQQNFMNDEIQHCQRNDSNQDSVFMASKYKRKLQSQTPLKQKNIQHPLRTHSNNQQGSYQNSENQDNYLQMTLKGQPRQQMSKIYAKNYRQKKKQHLKILQEQNLFLKHKIEDLSFRLKQTQLQLNKLKHNHESNTLNFQTSRQECLRQIQKVLQNQQSDLQQLLEVQNKLKNINTFNSKHKMDLLNYFMSELLENLISDFSFYFVDSLVSRTGLWRESQDIPFKKIDQQICEIYPLQDFKKFKQAMDAIPTFLLDHIKNFKGMWKKLYQDYLNIVHQGFMIEKLCQPLDEKVRKQNCRGQVLNYLRLQLYFQKIKYRKDMRQLRESWFKQFEKDQEHKTINKSLFTNKKTKVSKE